MRDNNDKRIRIEVFRTKNSEKAITKTWKTNWKYGSDIKIRTNINAGSSSIKEG